MAKIKIGNVKGKDGDNGVRGSKWYEGTAITGNSKTATVFSNSGITDALIDDYYLNTTTRYIYKCTTAGDASTAKWEYMTCLSFIDGDTWDSSTTYEPVTIVRHNGASYFSLKKSVGQEPSESSIYWRLIAKDGADIVIDSELSDTSENSVQNKIIKAQIDSLNQAIEDAKALKASLEQYGMVKLNDTSVVTDSTGLALPTTEKNPNIDGTLANQISQLNTNLPNLFSNPNLLINPDFRTNQRGGKIVESGKNYYSDESCGTLVNTTTSVYTATKISNGNYSISIDSTTYYVKASDVVDGYAVPSGVIKYTVDRWSEHLGGIVVPIDGGGIKYKKDQNVPVSALCTDFENKLKPDIYTLSMKIDGEIYVYTGHVGDYNETHSENDVVRFYGEKFQGYITELRLEIDANSNDELTIEWVKLELGSIATPFIPPDPATELLKCQREAYRPCNYLIESGVLHLDGNVYATIHLPTSMRLAPTISYSKIEVFYDGKTVQATGCNCNQFGGDSMRLCITGDFTIDIKPVTVQFIDLFFDAEIY